MAISGTAAFGLMFHLSALVDDALLKPDQLFTVVFQSEINALSVFVTKKISLVHQGLSFICNCGFIYLHSDVVEKLTQHITYTTYCILSIMNDFRCCTSQQVFTYSCVCVPAIW